MEATRRLQVRISKPGRFEYLIEPCGQFDNQVVIELTSIYSLGLGSPEIVIDTFLFFKISGSKVLVTALWLTLLCR